MKIITQKHNKLITSMIDRLEKQISLFDQMKDPDDYEFPEELYDELSVDFDDFFDASKETLEEYEADFRFVNQRLNNVLIHFSEIHQNKEQQEILLAKHKTLLSGSKGELTKNVQALQKLKQERAALIKKIEKLESEMGFKWYYIFAGPIWAFIIMGIRESVAKGKKLLEEMDLASKELEVDDAQGYVNKHTQVVGQMEASLKANESLFNSLQAKELDLDEQRMQFQHRTGRAQDMVVEIGKFIKLMKGVDRKKDSIKNLRTRLADSFLYTLDSGERASVSVRDGMLEWGKMIDEANSTNLKAVHLVCFGINENQEVGHFIQRSDKAWELVVHDVNAIEQALKELKTANWRPIHYFLNPPGPYGEVNRDQWSVYCKVKSSWDVQIDIWKSEIIATEFTSKKQFRFPITDISGYNPIYYFPVKYAISFEMIHKICAARNWRLATPLEITAAWSYFGFHSPRSGMISDGRFAIPLQSSYNDLAKGVNISQNHPRDGFYFLLAAHQTTDEYPKVKFHHKPGVSISEMEQICTKNNWRVAEIDDIVQALVFWELDIRQWVDSNNGIGRISDGLFARPLQTESPITPAAQFHNRGPNIIVRYEYPYYGKPVQTHLQLISFMPGIEAVEGFFYVQ
ncbi:MAG: hypothetical protein KDC34_03375 [Saprospiraceae bacterium]|nr:hypothetical protein [Saprospiraceae bacterium]